MRRRRSRDVRVLKPKLKPLPWRVAKASCLGIADEPAHLGTLVFRYPVAKPIARGPPTNSVPAAGVIYPKPSLPQNPKLGRFQILRHLHRRLSCGWTRAASRGSRKYVEVQVLRFRDQGFRFGVKDCGFSVLGLGL